MKTLAELRPVFPHWDKTRDMIDQCIDIMLNLRQSGHPGGSRSKVPGLVATMLSGVMRWDIRDPGKRFADRFILIGGHANPAVYAALAVLNEALRIKFRQTQDELYRMKTGDERRLVWEDLLTLRRNGGLPGHAEMEGKTLFFKFNTGPSGHGSPAAAGQALALKIAHTPQVRVFGFEGEGGLTTGVTHETLNSAWGLGLGNLIYFVDWNDYGIDDRPFSSVVYGTPQDWFASHGWHVEGTLEGEDWESLLQAYQRLLGENAEENIPKILWARMRKGRGYYVYDNQSHGTPHRRNSELFWKTKADFAARYNLDFEDFGAPAAPTWEGQVEQAKSMYRTVFSLLEQDPALVEYLTATLMELGDAIPDEIPACRITLKTPSAIPDLYNYETYPAELFAAPGSVVPNRIGFSKFASWLNTRVQQECGRPLVIAASADLADSTNISGFAKGWDGAQDFGFYQRDSNLDGTLLPQGITEFANAGILAGLATVNFSRDPEKEFNGFFGAFSTYGSFSYLKYGPIRLFSQIAQDSQLKVGKLIWVAGHSGPETAEDSRTHFGIFAPGVTQLFPEGQVINLHPWEHNEVAPVLAAALATEVPVIALHLTRPPVEIPDRRALGMASHLEAARGAYLVRDFDPGRPREGVVIIRGTSSTHSLVQILPRLQAEGPNVKIVAAISWELFQRQAPEYRRGLLSAQEWNDAMVITNTSRRQMSKWIANRLVEEYSLSSDWDNRWRTGGSVEEITAEAHLSPHWIWAGITRFAKDRPQRRQRLQAMLPD